MSHPFVETKEMTVGYRGVPLIRDIALRVHRGEILTLIGPNGSGKSTILKSLIRQLALIGGTVYLDGKSLQTLPERDLARTMSVLLTEHVRPELMTCWDVAAAGRYPYTGRLGLLSDEDRAKVDEALALVGADELADRDFSCISDGQRQRVLLARAICQEPEVIVLDEPTSFLDIRFKLELLTVLKQLVREKQVAVILSLHEIDLAQKLSDRLICVHNGRIERCGTPEQVFTGDYIRTLYDLERGTYNEQFGSLELERVAGEPRVFVIGGGGSGTALYRRLQRRGIPFAAGILPENDVELPTARALAVETVTERAYQPIGEDAYARAQALVRQCGNAVCCLDLFGPVNEKNRVLRDWAQQEGLLRSKSELGMLLKTQCCGKIANNANGDREGSARSPVRDNHFVTGKR